MSGEMLIYAALVIPLLTAAGIFLTGTSAKSARKRNDCRCDSSIWNGNPARDRRG